MKNGIFLFLLLISSAIFAQNCNIGNQSSTGFTNSADPIFKDYLVGIKFRLNDTGTVRTLNLIGRNTGTSVKMALYKDKLGVPGNLVDSTSIGTVTSGVVSFPITPTVLDTGFYWVMAIYSSNGGHTYSKTETGSNVYYNIQPFNSSIPLNASNFILYKSNTTFTYFLGIDCGITTGITQAANSSVINFYPNPATDAITINTLPNLVGKTYSITNISGIQIATGQLTNETNVIDIHGLEAGMYFMILGDREREIVKFVKQ